MDLGRDGLSQVAGDYEGDFPFTGRLTRVEFSIPAKKDAADVAAEAAAEFGRE